MSRIQYFSCVINDFSLKKNKRNYSRLYKRALKTSSVENLCTKVTEERFQLLASSVLSESDKGMFPTGMSSAFAVWGNAAGIAGNVFAFGLFVSPIPTFRRIIKNQSTEQFSGLPYIYALLNCLVCFWYGSPFVSPGVILIATVNSIGAVFQLVYICIFIAYANNTKMLKITGLLVAVFSVFVVMVFVSIRLLEPQARQIFVGYLSVASLISMFASPLFIMNLVIKTRSVEYMPFYLSLSTFLMSLSFSGYGAFKRDPFIYVPNGIGTLLGLVQLILYSYYSITSGEEPTRAPLLEHYP